MRGSFLSRRPPRQRPSREWPRHQFVQALKTHLEMARSFESLLSSLDLGCHDGAPKTIMITSTQPKEGKTTITLNLAITALRAGLKILIADGDLRRPSIHELLGLDNSFGLADLLNGSSDLARAVQSVEIFGSEAKPLGAIAGGKGSSKVLQQLGAANLRALLRDLANDYDLVLLDSPPVLAVNDPVLLATAVDGIIFVMAAGETKENQALRVKERLVQSGTPILGVVLNRFDSKLHGETVLPYHSYYERAPLKTSPISR